MIKSTLLGAFLRIKNNMVKKIKSENSILEISLTGRLDATSAEDTQNKLLSLLKEEPHQKAVINCEKLDYISSMGLRVFLRAVTEEKKAGRQEPVFKNVGEGVYEVLSVTGFTQVLEVEKAYRKISVEGCPVLGEGAAGVVYRIDPETVVKVYKDRDCIPLIKKEKEMATLAFLNGIPTAISYDIVSVGDKYGAIFELLPSKTFNDIVSSDTENADKYIEEYAHFIKNMHAISIAETNLPKSSQRFLEYLEDVKDIMPDRDYRKFHTLLINSDKNRHIIHGDLQMKNLLLCNGSPMLIDMDAISVGDPVFDLQGIYMTYVEFDKEEEDNCLKFLNIPHDLALHIWSKTMDIYFEGMSEEQKQYNKNKIKLVAALRFLRIIHCSDTTAKALEPLREKRTLTQISTLLKVVDDICIGKTIE